MTKRERFINFLGDKNSNERIASFWHHFPEDKWFSEGAVEAHLKFYNEAKIDFLKIMEEVRYDYSIDKVSDWNRYIPPKRTDISRKNHCDLIKQITNRIGGECFIYTTIFDPLRTVGITTGYDMLEAHIKEDVDIVSNAFSNMAESIAEYALDCLDAGADGIYFSSKGAEMNRFSETEFEKIVAVPDQYISDAIYEKNQNTILHICGFYCNLSYYTDFSAPIINWDCHQGSSLSQAAKLFPDSIILGGMKNHSGVLVEGTVQEIKDEVARVVSDFNISNRLILGADCTLDEDVDYARIAAVIEAYHQQ